MRVCTEWNTTVPGSWGHEKSVAKFKSHYSALVGISLAGIDPRQSFSSAKASVCLSLVELSKQKAEKSSKNYTFQWVSGIILERTAFYRGLRIAVHFVNSIM